MDSIPTSPAGTTGGMVSSVATAPVATGVGNMFSTTSTGAPPTIPTTPDASASVRPPAAAPAAASAAAAAAAPAPAAAPEPSLLAPPPPPPPADAAAEAAPPPPGGAVDAALPPPTAAPAFPIIAEIPGPYRTGPDVSNITPALHGSDLEPGATFANVHPSMRSTPQASTHGRTRTGTDATSGSVNRSLQKFASGAMPQLPPDPKNPLMYSQAVFNEQDEFVDNTGKYKLVMKGSYAAVEVALVPGDCVKAESGGMVSMSTNVHMEAKLEGTATEALTRCCCSGESMFLTYYSLKPGELRGDLLLAPSLPGEIMMLHVTEAQPWALQKSAYMASDPTITVTSKAQNISNACCSGEGLFVLKVGGFGRLCANSYGGIMRYVLRQGEERTIDNTYLVAWYEQMPMRIEVAGGSIGKSFLSGEGFVVTFTGPGIVYVQTRAGGLFSQ